ncbi:MAG: hypothetical protein ABI690_14040 [Chloroflexota bacterium]
MINQQTCLDSFQKQSRRLTRQITALSEQSRRFSWLRFWFFLIGVGITIAAFRWLGTSAGWVIGIISLAGFSTLVYLHRRLKSGIMRQRLWLQIKQAQIARLQLDWGHIPMPTKILSQPQHPFESDLDLIGERSLHHLINTATSVDGSKRLHEWLSNTNPELQVILERQQLVQELSQLPLFRDKLTLYSAITRGSIGKQWDGKALLGWLQTERTSGSLHPIVMILSILSAATIILFVLNNAGVIPPLWLITFLPYVGLSILNIARIGSLFDEAISLGEQLRGLKTIFGYLETYPYTKLPHLRTLCEPFLRADDKPSAHLLRVTRLTSAASLQRTQILWLFVNIIVPWDIFFAYLLDRGKAGLLRVLPTWLDVWYNLEALSSMANFAYLNPDYAFPSFGSKPENTAVLAAKGLGHPLLPINQKISNDFTIQKLGDVIIVTGSNMSGKSSFLRTLGVNLCLANAGSTVNAAVLEIPVFRLFTCIKVSDSVTDGISYFYAEVKRLKALLSELETTDQRPLFFLIDEIFRGTNNRERLIGSRAYVRALTGKNGTGVVSTHDLELITLAESIPKISNYHFEESIQDGRMVFDYVLRTGPSPTTNALKIMAIEGLPVEDSSDTA